MLIFFLLLFVPIGLSAARYYWLGDGRGNWQTADRSSAGLLPPASSHATEVDRLAQLVRAAAVVLGDQLEVLGTPPVGVAPS